jgi:hypothetical protein
MALLRQGCRVAALCPPGHPLRHVTDLSEIRLYRRAGSLASLLSAIRRVQPDAVVPCDDRCVAQLHELHDLYPHLRTLIERSLGRASGFAITESRGRLLELARFLGIRVPETRAVASAQQAAECYSSFAPAAAVKLDGTYGGEGVRIVHSPAEAATAYARLNGGVWAKLGTILKRMVVNRDPLALWSWGRHVKPATTIQRFVAGTPANIMAACWEGRILADVSVEAVSCQGATGAANVVRVIRNEEMSRAAALLAARLSLSGFFGLDFMLERATGAAYLIELNPRCTQLGHLLLTSRGDLAGAWVDALAGRRPAIGRSFPRAQTIAFFPQAWRWGATHDFLQSVHHDVPWEEHRLLEELLREPWPERQWSSRLYHKFRKWKPPEGVEFTAAKGIESGSVVSRDRRRESAIAPD